MISKFRFYKINKIVMGGLASTNLICLSNANSVTIHDYLLKNNSLTDVPTNQQYDYHEFS
jgi:hypothetical protein